MRNALDTPDHLEHNPFVGSLDERVVDCPEYCAMAFLVNAMLAAKSKFIEAAKAIHSAELKKYAMQTASAMPQFLSHCLTQKSAPPLFSDTYRLLVDGFLPVLATSYLYGLMEYLHGSSKAHIPTPLSWLIGGGLMMFGIAIFFLTLLRKIEFQIRIALLLIALPKAFHTMPKPLDIKPLDDSVCQDCSKLRLIKGEIRSIVIYFYRQIVLSLISKLPLIGPLLSYLIYPLQAVYLGQVIAEYYYASSGICERHRNVNFQHYSALFFMIGFLYQATTTMLSALLPFCGAVLPIMNAHENTLRSIGEKYFGAVLLLYFIGLTYYLPFPKTIKVEMGSFPGLGAQWVADRLIKHVMIEIKEVMKNPEEISVLRSLFQFTKTAVAIAQEELNALSQRSRVNQFMNTFCMQLAVPAMFRSKTNFLHDPIISRYWPPLFEKINASITIILNLRESALGIFKLAHDINTFLSNRKIRLVSRIVLGCAVAEVGEMFTLKYVVEEGLVIIDGILRALTQLKDYRLLTQASYETKERALVSVKNTIHQVKRIMHELPDEMADHLYALLQSQQFVNWLMSISKWTSGHLMTRNTDLVLEAFDVVTAEDAEPEPVVVARNESVVPSAVAAQSVALTERRPISSVLFRETEDDFVDIDEQAIKEEERLSHRLGAAAAAPRRW